MDPAGVSHPKRLRDPLASHYGTDASESKHRLLSIHTHVPV